MAKTFQFTREVLLPRPLDQVFPFFAAAGNLEDLTPPWLKFEILSPEVPMEVGTLIDYRLRLHGIPIRWQSEITTWEPPHRFVDQQRRGPYKQWVHEHRFLAKGDKTLVIDDVRYQVTGGALINKLFVAGDLQRIFGYRHQVLRDRFDELATDASQLATA